MSHRTDAVSMQLLCAVCLKTVKIPVKRVFGQKLSQLVCPACNAQGYLHLCSVAVRRTPLESDSR